MKIDTPPEILEQRKANNSLLLIWIALWTALLPVLLVIPWLFFTFVMNGYKIRQTYNLWLEKLLLTNNAWLWLMLLPYFIGVIVICVVRYSVNDDNTEPEYKDDFLSDSRERQLNNHRSERAHHSKGLGNNGLAVATSIIAILALVASFVIYVGILWNNDKDEANYYNAANVFVVPDLAHPATNIKLLVEGAKPADGRKVNGTACELVGKHSTPSCIKQGELPQAGWDTRVASLKTAIYLMGRSSSTDSLVDLRNETVTYLYDDYNPAKPNHATGKWSGILDGTGREQGISGVAEWDGVHTPTKCEFADSAFNLYGRAFDGSRGNSLPNLMAEKFPQLKWSLGDSWGYCKTASQPVIVVPVARQIHIKHRSVLAPAGVLVFDGSQAFFKYQSTVKADEYPGPVYPMSMATLQRERSKWAAGRKYMQKSRFAFGYEPSDGDYQAGNNAEFLLRSRTDHRLYWVTPGTPRNSNSQALVSVSMVPADEVTDGRLNTFTTYAFAKSGDPRVFNLDNLNNQAVNFVRSEDTTFKLSGGVIREYTPGPDGSWRAFAEMNGQVVYLLDISPTNAFSPKLVKLDPETGMPASDQPVAEVPTPGSNQPTADLCTQPRTKLTLVQLLDCIAAFSQEARRRG